MPGFYLAVTVPKSCNRTPVHADGAPIIYAPAVQFRTRLDDIGHSERNMRSGRDLVGTLLRQR